MEFQTVYPQASEDGLVLISVENKNHELRHVVGMRVKYAILWFVYHNVHNVVDLTGPSESHVSIEYVQYANKPKKSPSGGSYGREPTKG